MFVSAAAPITHALATWCWRCSVVGLGTSSSMGPSGRTRFAVRKDFLSVPLCLQRSKASRTSSLCAMLPYRDSPYIKN